MKKIFLYLSLFLLPALRIAAQDFHLSHYEAAQQYVNPATTGMFMENKDDFHVNAIYRTQWRSLSKKPFTTTYLSYENSHKKRFGVGGYVINNRSGLGSFNTLNFLLSGAYKITNDSKKHNLSVGMQMGIIQKSYDPYKHLFDNQYSSSSSSFDPELPNGESFGSTQVLKYDANMGIFYKNTDEDKKVNPYAGFSIFHITQPNEALAGNVSRLPMRFALQAGSDIIVDEKYKVAPIFTFMMQAKASEIMAGSLVYYTVNDSLQQYVIGGFSWRNKDAIVIHGGIKYGQNIYRVSYDINTSYLKNFSKGRGALEFSVIYTGDKKKLKKKQASQM